ncbi:hypothetical protein ACX0G9_10865 [Flavitalea flava]
MLDKFKSFGRLNLGVELSKNEQKKIVGGCGGYNEPSCTGGGGTGGGGTTPSGAQTYCSGGGSGPFPTCGPYGCSSQIGCQPAYCPAAGHGSFLYCA